MAYNHGTIEERFWQKVIKLSDAECWEWQANKNNKGYGLIYWRKYMRKVLAHRVSYELHIAPLEKNICVLHRCDTPACVNPKHLFLGTKLDNVRDMDAKRRRKTVHNPLYPPPIHRGEAANAAKLTEAQVLEIRDLMAAGATGPQIAIKFSIDRSTANRIKRRFGWKHI